MTSDERPLGVVTFNCDAATDLAPQALGLTYWFDVAPDGEPYAVTIRFTGHRVGVRGKPGPRDRFSVVESVERVVPGSGPIAITARVFDVAPGTWNVTAAPASDARPRTAARRSMEPGRPSLPKATTSGATAYGPVVGIRAPGAHLGVWPALVGLGAVVALITQAILAGHVGLDVSRVLLVSGLACLVGLLGAKVYYLTGHLIMGERPRLWTVVSAGMCIQGFVIGAIGTLVIGAAALSVPVRPLLDITAPGLLFGMTIGRFGCFFGGCCAGRATGSRWGLWSSDRRLGMRRVPSQLLEGAVAFVVGTTALLIVWFTTPGPAGVVFVGAISGYTLGRQFVFPLRANPGHTAYGRIAAMTLTGLVLATDIAIAVIVK